MEFNKRDMKSILKAGAKARGILLSEFRADLQATVDEAIESPDHEVPEKLQRVFWEQTPTPEE
ncbi:hypothetical protein SAMN02745196_00817 [Clostridium collagenovorans DSM 3089]|uniref:Uncharacterized protein n=2 Tax=Clostridium TaxID=1485 RepID=A0A1M5U2E3_9CLOT|nr:hypothetical protein SAMN02745196_00817 [Clostridium collagenovorans DSM 3089]